MLYVHIPFCVHKCHYCDFNSHERQSPDWESYQQALISELQTWANSPMYAGRKLSSIFIGGGTPSLAPPGLIEKVIHRAERLFGYDDNIEITLEANPGSADAANFSAYRRAGVNRLSMGIQSLDDQELAWLERVHDRRQVLKAVDIARDAGFDNINLDLIYGLPDQSLEQWLKSLNSVIALGTEHLSCYQLTIEPHTKLATTHAINPINIPDDELAIAMFRETRKQLQSTGFEAYEISNFAKPELKCRHNDGYWKYHDYIGIGAGAAGKWDDRTERGVAGVTRYSNIRRPESYIKAVANQGRAINTQESLDINRAAAESIWLGLRRSGGINCDAFRNRFGFDLLEQVSNTLQPWQKQQMLHIDENTISLTENGLIMADAIAESVL